MATFIYSVFCLLDREIISEFYIFKRLHLNFFKRIGFRPFSNTFSNIQDTNLKTLYEPSLNEISGLFLKAGIAAESKRNAMQKIRDANNAKKISNEVNTKEHDATVKKKYKKIAEDKENAKNEAVENAETTKKAFKDAVMNIVKKEFYNGEMMGIIFKNAESAGKVFENENAIAINTSSTSTNNVVDIVEQDFLDFNQSNISVFSKIMNSSDSGVNITKGVAGETSSSNSEQPREQPREVVNEETEEVDEIESIDSFRGNESQIAPICFSKVVDICRKNIGFENQSEKKSAFLSIIEFISYIYEPLANIPIDFYHFTRFRTMLKMIYEYEEKLNNYNEKVNDISENNVVQIRRLNEFIEQSKVVELVIF